MKITVSAPGMNQDASAAAQGAAAQGNEATELDLPDGATVESLVARLGLSEFTPESALVNGEERSLNHPLSEGDAVALSGPSGAMEQRGG